MTCEFDIQNSPFIKRHNGAKLVALVAVLVFSAVFAAPVCAAPAKERPELEAEKLYHELGNSMFCLCGGCRERLLDCSMVNCSFKETAQRYLREECRDASLSSDQIRAHMVTRFGPAINQVQGDSLLYPVLFGTGFGILVVFGLALWFVSTRAKGPAEPEARGEKSFAPELEARIAREVEDIE